MSTFTVRAIVEQEPREVLDWGVDWTEVLESGETVTAATWSVPASQSGLGIVLSSLELIGNIAYVRMEVSSGEQDNERWDDDGVVINLTCEATTSDLREFSRTLLIRMKRYANSPRRRVLMA